MTTDEIKKYARTECGVEITDEAAANILNELSQEGLLADESLAGVAGGIPDEIAERSALSAKFREKRKKDLEERLKNKINKDRLA